MFVVQANCGSTAELCDDAEGTLFGIIVNNEYTNTYAWRDYLLSDTIDRR